jgi:arginine utilization protein RocB
VRETILNTLIELVGIQSLNGIPHAEDAYVDFLYGKLSGWDYFSRHPEDLYKTAITGDALKRHNLTAIVRCGDRSCKKAILYINHHDVVGIEDIDAFYPLKYKEKLAQSSLSEEARRDLQSGEWLFGRGVSDMKGGAAVQLALLKEYSEIPETLNVNIIFLSLADEENTGLGVQQAVRSLAALKRDGWEFLLCVDSEPTITGRKKDGGIIYTGSIGNITVLTLFVGRASHVGEFYDGISAAVLAAKMIYETEGDPETADSHKGQIFPPTACLIFKNLSTGYSVTLPDRAAAVFNMLPAEKSAKEILDYFVKKAMRAGEEALRKHYKSSGMRVITFGELKELAGSDIGLEGLAGEDIYIAFVNRMISAANLSGPLAVVCLIPPYCGARLNRGETELELKAMGAAEGTAAYAKELTGKPLAIEGVYEGISDLSEMGLDERDIKTLTENLAGYGTLFTYPFEEMKSLDIPVINLGPIGKDAHKWTERVHIPYLTETLPLLLKRLTAYY